MIPVLTKDQAYKLDKDTIDSGHINLQKLMDNAGKAVAQFFCEKIKDPFNQKVVVVCGKGNNPCWSQASPPARRYLPATTKGFSLHPGNSMVDPKQMPSPPIGTRCSSHAPASPVDPVR